MSIRLISFGIENELLSPVFKRYICIAKTGLGSGNYAINRGFADLIIGRREIFFIYLDIFQKVPII